MRYRLRILGPFFGLLYSAPTDARTWYVQPDGTGDAPTIQAAIDSAQAGDEVLLAPGTYTWTSQVASGTWMLQMKRNVTLRGEQGAQATILDAETLGGVIECVDVDQARIEGLTLTRGGLHGRDGAGISSTGDSRLTIADCVVIDNHAVISGGGGINCTGCSILRCEIVDNRAAAGGGIGVFDGLVSMCTIRGNAVTGDPGGAGGGIAASGSSTISDCLIEDNSAFGPFGSDGGGIIASGNTLITRCTFAGNFAGNGSGSGGAIRCFENVSISDCIFIGNTAAGSRFAGVGGAISCASGSQISIDGCTLFGNRAIDHNPPHVVPPVGGIYLDFAGNAVVTIASTIIARSEGVACYGAGAIMSCNDLYGNSLGDAVCGTDSGGNFSADPLFCNDDPITTRDVSIRANSPCVPGHHPEGAACGFIGGADVDCPPLAVEKTTWSQVKHLYRR